MPTFFNVFFFPFCAPSTTLSRYRVNCQSLISTVNFKIDPSLNQTSRFRWQILGMIPEVSFPSRKCVTLFWDEPYCSYNTMFSRAHVETQLRPHVKGVAKCSLHFHCISSSANTVATSLIWIQFWINNLQKIQLDKSLGFGYTVFTNAANYT